MENMIMTALQEPHQQQKSDAPKLINPDVDNDQHRAWPHRKEINWLNRIGNSLYGYVGAKAKKALLEGYLKGCGKRVDWGDIDKEKCLKHAKKLLAEIIQP